MWKDRPTEYASVRAPGASHPRGAPMRRRAGGFTLVELLVVVAIIALLISILLPALGKAKDATKTLRCAANLKQIELGFALYRSDFRGYLPPLNSYVSYNANGTSKGYGMWNCIGPYTGMPQWGGIEEPAVGEDDPTHLKFDSYWGKYKVKYGLNKTVWACPEADPLATPWGHGSGGIYAESMYLVYNGATSNNPRPWSFPRKTWLIPTPSENIHVADSMNWHLGKVSDVGVDSAYGYAFNIYRHQDGANVSFVDGHVTYFRSDYILQNITRDPDSKSMMNFTLR